MQTASPQRNLTRRAFSTLAACAVLGLVGCVDQHPARKSIGLSGSERIVATSVAIAEICDRLELDLVGVPKTSRALPARYQNVEAIGAPMAPDLELLSSMRPDFVISPNTLIEDLQVKYAAASLPCIFLDLRSVEGMYDSIAYLGDKFSRRTQSAALAAEYIDFLAAYKARVPQGEPVRVLLLMGVPGSYLVATENSYVGSLVKLAGGINVYQETSEEFLNANTEDMQAKDPDVILRAAHALPDDIKKMFAEEFATNSIWSHFRAVQEGRVFDLSYELFGMSATFLYPQALEELFGYLYGNAVGRAG